MEKYKEYKTEPELLSIALLLEEYRIPYEQQGDAIFLPKKAHGALDKLLQKEEERKQEWAGFARFDTKAILENTIALLNQHNIPYQVSEHESNLKSHSNNPLDQYYTLNLRLGDFDKVYQLQRAEAEQQLIYKAADYYLRGLTDKELMDILEEPEDWNVVDVVGAQKLLAERGVIVSEEDMELMRLRHLIELSRPSKASFETLLGAYAFAIVGGIFGIFWGLHLMRDKRVLPNGRKVITFDAATRAHGQRVLNLSIIMIILTLIGIFYSGILTA